MEGRVGFSASSSGVADYKNLPGGNRLLIEVLSEHEQHLLDHLFRPLIKRTNTKKSKQNSAIKSLQECIQAGNTIDVYEQQALAYRGVDCV